MNPIDRGVMPHARDTVTVSTTEQITEQPTDETTAEPRDEAMPDGLTEGGKAALKAEREARKQAAKEARELKERLAAMEAKQAEADAAKAKAEEAEAIRRGEFEKLATERAETITAITGERDGLKAKLDQALTLLASTVETEWNDAPEAVRKLYKGEPTDPLAKKAFLADHAELIAELTATAEARRNQHRTPQTPVPNPKALTVDDAKARREQATISSI